jgi:hypothetical protein
LIDYLKKKVTELLDSLIAPAWQRVLAWPWLGKALVAVIALGIVYVVSFPESAKSAWSITSCAIRVAWAGESSIPIASSVSKKVKDVIARLSSTLEPDLALPDKGDMTPWSSPWTIAQVTLATYQIGNSVDAKRIASFFRTASETTCSCWRELPKNPGKPRNIFISGWILLALARIGETGTGEEIRFLLDEQHDGWWSVFPVAHESQYASSYGTAWALLGLHAQFTKGINDANDARRVSAAIQRGAAWLLAHREDGARWKDYPLVPSGRVSQSISGVVLHALHQVVPQQLQQLDREWLENLPQDTVSASDADHPYFWFMTKDGYANDDFVQIRLPWLLIGTADAYRNGSIIQRSKTLAWLEKALEQRSVMTADTNPENWWRAELLYALRHILESS